MIIDELEYSIRASIGVAKSPHDGTNVEELLRKADMAMYEAKNKGRNQVRFFTQKLLEKQKQFFSVESALRDALLDPDSNFALHFQPRVEIASGNIYSVEALIRWKDQKLGYIPPTEFIPLAEDLGLIEQIDEWVLRTACKKAARWKGLSSGVRIAVNISGLSFNQPHFVSQVVEPTLKQYGIDGHCLEMEITEGVLLADTQQMLRRLQALKDLGIVLAIDDFGTGFSSLSYLNHFPIDSLKIDGCFICDHSSAESEKALLKAIIALGRALNMTVVAECVETEAQMQYLLSLDCHEGQGYFWYRPDAQWEPTQALNLMSSSSAGFD